MILPVFHTPQRLIGLILLVSQFMLAGCSIVGTAGRVSAAPAPQAPATGERSPRFNRISINEGLSQSVVNDILQDSQGYLWFATQDGLNRYDGYGFKVFKHDPTQPNSLSHSHVTRLLEDSQGQIWMGTASAGVTRYDPLTQAFTRFLPNPQDPAALPGGMVNDIIEDRQGRVWVAVSGGGISRFDAVSGGFSSYRSDPGDPSSLVSNDVVALVETADGSLWAATPYGLDQLDPETGQFTHYRHNPDQPDSLSSNNLCRLFVDHLGRLWIGTRDNGLDRFDPKTGQFTRYGYNPQQAGRLPGKEVWTITEDHTGRIWVGVARGGLCWLDESTGKFSCYQHDPVDPSSLSAGEVVSVYEDRSGVLWVGTFGGGVSQLNPDLKPFQHLYYDPEDPDSLGGSMIFAVFAEPDGTLWIGTEDGGLDRLDRSAGTITHYRHDPLDANTLSSDRIRSLYVASTGQVWVGTDSGLDVIDPQTGDVSHVFAKASGKPLSVGYGVTAIVPGVGAELWVATLGGGLYRLTLGPSSQITGIQGFSHHPQDPASLAENAIYSLAVEPDGTVWVGTFSAGLDRFDPATRTFFHYPGEPANPSALSDSTVLAVYPEPNGPVWVGTTGGLNRLERADGIFSRYRTKDGLPNDVIYAIQPDTDGQLWMSTNYGLARFDPKSETFKSYDMQDGLQSNEFNSGASFRAADGELFFGGIAGLNTFYPRDIQENPYVPPVVLTGLSQAEDAIDPGAEVTLRWPDNSFSFEFAALNYIRSERNLHAYRLEGFEDDWNMIGTSRIGRFTNLPGGTYTLRLKGSNNDGVWNESGASIRVRVIPPFWNTWLFRGAVLLLITAFVAFEVRLRTRSILSRNEELERLVRARTSEIEQLYAQAKELVVFEERNRLARELHDSAKQKAFAALAQLGAANGLLRTNPLRAQDSMKEAETLVYEVIEELTFLIQEMYPAALKEKGLAVVLQEYLYEWEGRTGIPVDFRIPGGQEMPLHIEQALYRVTQEALANVARHSCAQRVGVELEYSPNAVRLVIRDDGQGFELGRRPAGVGLRSMQERIAMVGGKLNIESAPGKGTHISVCAPLPETALTEEKESKP